MPLVAPFPGVTNSDWVKCWWEAGKALGDSWQEKPFGPLARAPDAQGVLTVRRRCSSDEAGHFLRIALCEAEGDEEVRFTSHSLKATTLTWTAKRGLSKYCQLMLGHHAPESNSLAAYSRDLLSRPLGQYVSVLEEVRDGRFRPNLTRSGLMAVAKPGMHPEGKPCSSVGGDDKEPKPDCENLHTMHQQTPGLWDEPDHDGNEGFDPERLDRPAKG